MTHVRMLRLSLCLAMGSSLSQSQLLKVVTTFDADGSGAIDLNVFLAIITWLKMKNAAVKVDSETLSLFESLGGGPGMRGHVRGDLIIRLCRELGLTIEIADLIEQVDTDGSGQIEYEEFATLIGGSDSGFDGAWDEDSDVGVEGYDSSDGREPEKTTTRGKPKRK